ncbi:hypothetical protein MAP00_005720 [Monascus purpureus]|nr:hypothetical protein MAP00_005720 [Monascus purpureus]
MIAVDGPKAGNASALCQFQGFCLQMFPLADVLFTLATACNVLLVVFYQYDAESLRKLEVYYTGVITFLVGVPAIVFFFIRSAEKGPFYGSVDLWCSISHEWVLFRIIFYYGPIWFIITIITIIYCLVGIKIFNLKRKFKSICKDHIVLTSKTSNNAISVTVQVDSHSQSQSHPLNLVRSRDAKEPSIQTVISPSATHQSSDSSLTLIQKLPDQSPMLLRQYLLMPVLFFLILLATWVVPTINRVSSFVNPKFQSYGLMIAVGAMGSLRGFWNGVLFIAIGLKGWKRQRDLDRRLVGSKPDNRLQ